MCHEIQRTSLPNRTRQWTFGLPRATSHFRLNHDRQLQARCEFLIHFPISDLVCVVPPSAMSELFPNELLIAIFQHLVDDPNDIIRITYVCSGWRSAAIGASELWKNFTMDDSIACVAQWQLFLERSRASPLSLSIRPKQNLPRITHKKIRAIRNNTRRLGRFFLYMTPSV